MTFFPLQPLEAARMVHAAQPGNEKARHQFPHASAFKGFDADRAWRFRSGRLKAISVLANAPAGGAQVLP
jgi:hypothetical protein